MSIIFELSVENCWFICSWAMNTIYWVTRFSSSLLLFWRAITIQFYVLFAWSKRNKAIWLDALGNNLNILAIVKSRTKFSTMYFCHINPLTFHKVLVNNSCFLFTFIFSFTNSAPFETGIILLFEEARRQSNAALCLNNVYEMCASAVFVDIVVVVVVVVVFDIFHF